MVTSFLFIGPVGVGALWSIPVNTQPLSPEGIDRLSVTSYPLPHAASGSDKGPVTTPSLPTTRDPVVQAPSTVQGAHKYMEIAKITEN